MEYCWFLILLLKNYSILQIPDPLKESRTSGLDILNKMQKNPMCSYRFKDYPGLLEVDSKQNWLKNSMLK